MTMRACPSRQCRPRVRSDDSRGVLMSLEPAVAALSGFVLLGEHLRIRAWVALVLVVVASAGASRRRAPELPLDA